MPLHFEKTPALSTIPNLGMSDMQVMPAPVGSQNFQKQRTSPKPKAPHGGPCPSSTIRKVFRNLCKIYSRPGR